MNNHTLKTLNCEGIVPSKRTYHASCTLRKWMLMYGGFDVEDKNDFWSFDLENTKWKQFSISGPNPPRKFHSLTVIGNNAYLFGGCVKTY